MSSFQAAISRARSRAGRSATARSGSLAASPTASPARSAPIRSASPRVPRYNPRSPASTPPTRRFASSRATQPRLDAVVQVVYQTLSGPSSYRWERSHSRAMGADAADAHRLDRHRGASGGTAEVALRFTELTGSSHRRRVRRPAHALSTRRASARRCRTRARRVFACGRPAVPELGAARAAEHAQAVQAVGVSLGCAHPGTTVVDPTKPAALTAAIDGRVVVAGGVAEPVDRDVVALAVAFLGRPPPGSGAVRRPT